MSFPEQLGLRPLSLESAEGQGQGWPGLTPWLTLPGSFRRSRAPARSGSILDIRTGFLTTISLVLDNNYFKVYFTSNLSICDLWAVWLYVN